MPCNLTHPGDATEAQLLVHHLTVNMRSAWLYFGDPRANALRKKWDGPSSYRAGIGGGGTFRSDLALQQCRHQLFVCQLAKIRLRGEPWAVAQVDIDTGAFVLEPIAAPSHRTNQGYGCIGQAFEAQCRKVSAAR